VLVISLVLLAGAAASPAQAAVRSVSYHGYVVTVPRAWPIYYLARAPRTCVRFDRHALYLGTPSALQRCPAHLAGRTEAILVEPRAKRGPRARAATNALPSLGARATTFAVPGRGVVVAATWSRDQNVVMRALHRRSLPASPASASAHRARKAIRAHAASAVYNGLGFDACQAPSQSQMSAWASSPYRAIGVYIGGVNAACAQPNLTSTWVSTQVAAGWHLIPTYVGLQAPSNSCRCSSITPSQASAQGAAAATDAVNDAAAIGVPAGNPIYYDMEGYSRTSTNSSAVLAFLSAWTSQLHADGYASGVYSSGASGITDLVGQQGTGYLEPDDIWIADWNNQQTTDDPYVPSSDWANQQRLHQYKGAHNETYGGVTINIDGDYLDGATADTTSGSVTPAEPPTTPSLTLTPLANGTTTVAASWSGSFGVSAWRILAGFDSTGATLSSIAQTPAKGAVTRLTVRNGAPYFAVQALGSSGQVLSTSSAVATPPHLSLLGPGSYAPAKGGLAGVPVGCYTGSVCHVKLTLRAGRSTVASTGSEYVPSGSAALVYYRLNSRGRTLLAHARRNRLAVQATVRDVSGAGATAKLNVIAVSTSGRAPAHHAVQGPTLRVVNPVDYVSLHGVGGILTVCRNTPVCHIATTLKVGKTVIAQTGAENLGANQMGYLIFRLTARGRTLLARARGNQLGARLTLTDAGTSTSTRIVLVRFS
jgi:hypothetical protein